jgi:heterodisulfide reductase subunit C
LNGVLRIDHKENVHWAALYNINRVCLSLPDLSRNQAFFQTHSPAAKTKHGLDSFPSFIHNKEKYFDLLRRFPLNHPESKKNEVAHVESLAHTKVADCYQCGKCSAGCPRAEQMDVLPSTIIRLIQYGDVKKAASSESVWQCLACLTCSARCPKSVDIAGVMDALKQISLEKKCVHPKQKHILAFQQAFLNAIQRNGRTNELEMVTEYKIRSFLGDGNVMRAMKDAELGLPMLMRNKLHIKIGSSVKDKALVKRIFAKCEEG